MQALNADRYSNQRVNESLQLFYILSEERGYVGEKLIPRRIKSKDIDYLLDKGHTFDRLHLFNLIRFTDSVWMDKKLQEMRSWH